MGNIVAIDPGNHRPGFDGHERCVEREIVDPDGRRGGRDGGVRNDRNGSHHQSAGDQSGRLEGQNLEGAVHSFSLESYASVESISAIRSLPRTKTASVIPSIEWSCSVGTLSGPGDGAVPATGCGKAVERAVWKAILPSTFCVIWWIWPLSTVTEPKRARSFIASVASSVPQPHSASAVHTG